MSGEQGEEELAARQDARLYPLGRVLRATYDADNHDSLDPAVMGLMLDLSRIDERRAAPVPVQRAAPVMPEPTLIGRLLGRIAPRHRGSI